MADEEEILARHRKEKKDLQAKVQGLKKNAGKKNKKEVLAEIEKLEKDLESRHLEELRNLSLNDPPPEPAAQEPPAEASDEPRKPSKAQKRRDKKSEKERERQQQIEEESEEHRNGPRNLENARITELLKSRSLMIFPIAADGDCLYNSVSHQLRATGRTPLDVKELRSIASEYIRENRESLLPFLSSPETNECLTDAEFEDYCEKLETTRCWGGQVEIMALANALKVPIEVLQASGPPTLQSSEQAQGPNLVLTYHRHFVSLGEHYNSTQVLEVPEDED